MVILNLSSANTFNIEFDGCKISLTCRSTTKYHQNPSKTFVTLFYPLDLPKNPGITRRQILDSSQLKEFADDNFKFDENGRKLSKWVENTVGKGEIAR